jgi:hypothetical protein
MGPLHPSELLWHMGRISHPDFREGTPPVALSAIAIHGANGYLIEVTKAVTGAWQSAEC